MVALLPLSLSLLEGSGRRRSLAQLHKCVDSIMVIVWGREATAHKRG